MFLGLCGLDHHNFWFQSALELCCATTKMKILQTLLLGGANMANLTRRGYCYFLCSVFCKENMFVH